jgi:hypothetical protein
METKEYRTIDKSAWPRGPWDQEPDKVQWKDEATGLPCLIVRAPHGGLCGYVGLAEGHQYFGKGYDDVPVEVHGGLTFADKCQPHASEEKGICHVPGPGEADHVWWFGFDCAHAGDRNPAYEYLLAGQKDRYPHHCPWNESGYDEYRDLTYVKSQVAALARQLVTV